MTKREAIVLSAYTGVLMADFADVHRYVEALLGRPVLTHELTSDLVQWHIQEAARDEFSLICESANRK